MLHKNSLTGESQPAAFLYNLTKNLTSQSAHLNCAVLPYIFGFSDGGNLGIVFTLRYPQYVEKLAVMGSNIHMFGTNFTDEIKIIRKYLRLSRRAKKTGDPQIALQRDIEGMMVGQPKLSFRDIAAICIPVLNIFGQHDMIRRTHSRRITRAIPDCRELMVIGGGHSTCFRQTDTVIAPALLRFFADA